MRCFISIDIPDNIKKEIIKIQERLPEFSGKTTEKENLHLTLKFLGEINDKDVDEIKKRLNKIKFKKFETEMNSIGMFSDRIIWINMKNCMELQKEIDDELSGLFRKEERFMGHLTIARIKHLDNKKDFIEKLKEVKIKPIKFQVNSFKLKKSVLGEVGPAYEDIEVYNLN